MIYDPTFWPSYAVFRWLRYRRDDMLAYLEGAGDFAECYPSFCPVAGAVRRSDDGGYHWIVNTGGDDDLRAAILSGRLTAYSRDGAEVYARLFEGAGRSRPWPEFGCRRADVLRLWPTSGGTPARRGRQPAEYWSAIEVDALQWLDFDGEPPTLRELETVIARLAATMGHDPGEATVRRHARKFLDEHRRRRAEGS